MSRVGVSELRDMVQRMEQRLCTHDRKLVRELMAAYHKLVPHFAADLGDERDELLSRGGALMLIQQVWRKDA